MNLLKAHRAMPRGYGGTMPCTPEFSLLTTPATSYPTDNVFAMVPKQVRGTSRLGTPAFYHGNANLDLDSDQKSHIDSLVPSSLLEAGQVAFHCLWLDKGKCPPPRTSMRFKTFPGRVVSEHQTPRRTRRLALSPE